jgi:hypothetical protein
MTKVSVDLIDYQILSKTEAIIQSCDASDQTLIPRNLVAFRGNLVKVAHSRSTPLRGSVNIIVIHYCFHAIFGDEISFGYGLQSMVFEFGSELEVLGSSAFRGLSFQSLFIPQSVSFIGSSAFSNCHFVTCLFFDPNSSLHILRSEIFFPVSLTSIVIPATVE